MVRVSSQSLHEALLCPLCEGKGWCALVYRPFRGRKSLEGVQMVRPTQGHTRYLAGERLPSSLTLAEFEVLYPADDPDTGPRGFESPASS